MIPTIDLRSADAAQKVASLLGTLRLDPRAMLLPGSSLAEKHHAVEAILIDVAQRGDDAIVDLVRKFDDPGFTIDRLRVTRDEMKAAHARCDGKLIDAMRRSIEQVREYQTHFLPGTLPNLNRDGVELGLRYTPVDSAGLHVPGGKASYPSSLIMLAVPAQVAGVKRIVVSTPASKYSQNDLLLAAAHELNIGEMYRAGGTGAIAAFAFGTQTIKPVDKIAGPGNSFIQIAKKLVSGAVGVDGFYGPSEILVLADDSAEPRFIAADLLAQAEHDPGRCFLLTDSAKLAEKVRGEVERQLATLSRSDAIVRALKNESAIVIGAWNELFDLANQLAAEHVNLQLRDVDGAMKKLRHAGAIFIGPFSPVAAGDYVAGPSHSLPTNTTAKFGGGISTLEFMKRTGTVRYASRDALARDAGAAVEMAKAEGLDAHGRWRSNVCRDRATIDDRSVVAYLILHRYENQHAARRLLMSRPHSSDILTAMAPPSFVRANVRAMHGYSPGEQPGPGVRVVKLNTNENPFPPSPKVLDAIREIDAETLRRYPNPVGQKFRETAASLLKLATPDMVICGNGSDDILTIATRTFVAPGGTLASPEPTYSLYPVLANLEDAKHVGVAWEKNYTLPIDGLLDTNADAIYLANPNAPTGTIVPTESIAELAKKFGKLVLVDEAYVDFADKSAVELVEKHENLVISRTLSKGYGLAGLRFGYAVAQPSVIEEMMKVKDSYNADAISIVAATAALQDQEYAQQGLRLVREERERVTTELTRLGFDVIPSHANFVLAGVPGGDGKAFYLGLKQQGILIRFFDKPGLRDKIRITIGTMSENDAMLGGIKQLLEKQKAA
ncbi:MAG: histidinol dehydrogenase [Tepidisphaeraceae bacterium]